MLVSMEMARNHLRVDGSDDDEWIGVMLPAVSNAVLLWLKDPARAYVMAEDSNGDQVPEVDSSGDPVPLPAVQAAVLIELASQYRFRDGQGADRMPDASGHGYVLCAGATAMLAALRKPTVA